MSETATWKPWPVSTATNAYDLLEEVCKVIEEEPLRYDQSDWIRNYREYYSSKDEAIGIGIKGGAAHIPECGTVGCVAGWIAVLKCDIPAYTSDASTFAKNVLGLTYSQKDTLFDGSAVVRQYIRENPEVLVKINDDREWRGWDLTMDDIDSTDNDLRTPDGMPKQGSLEYAMLGVRHIRRFMAANEAQLRAQVVEVTNGGRTPSDDGQPSS